MHVMKHVHTTHVHKYRLHKYMYAEIHSNRQRYIVTGRDTCAYTKTCTKSQIHTRYPHVGRRMHTCGHTHIPALMHMSSVLPSEVLEPARVAWRAGGGGVPTWHVHHPAVAALKHGLLFTAQPAGRHAVG